MRNVLTENGLFGWNYWYLVRHPWVIVEESYCHVKWFCQRGARGYADCDVWSLDSYLCRWMPKALAELQANKTGHPVGMTRKGWDNRLERMKRGFTEAQKIMDMDYRTPRECRTAQRRMQHDLHVFTEHFLSLWD